MLFVLIGLWTVGLLFIITDPKRMTTRWISSIAFSGGFGGLSAVIGDDLIPYLYDQGLLNETVSLILRKVERISSLLCYYGLPYTFFIFTMVYYPNASNWSFRSSLPWLALVPVLLSLVFPPEPGYPIPYYYVSWWAAPYIVTGIALLVLATVQEKNTFLRKSRMLTIMAAAPTMLFALFTLYLLPLFFDLYEAWRYNAWVIAFTLAVIVGSSFRYGFMGLQISIQNQKLDYTLRAITSGTSILNHAIKNDVGKIRLFGEKIKADAGDGTLDSHEVVMDADVILSATKHIYDMIERIQGQTQEVVLHIEELHPANLLKEALQGLLPCMHQIEVKEELHYAGTIAGDRAQLMEVFVNVLTNAQEAMPHGGELTVRLTETKRTIVVEIRDTGIGMEKRQLKRIFDPFYTTKSGKKLNFGLGLSYCYHMIQKHKGTMNVHSKPGSGTSVFIQFPKKKRLPVGRELV